jgi:hypothetical protein
MEEWQPIETAPKDGTDILVSLWGGENMLVLCYNDENPKYPWMSLDGPSYHKDAPTHWMALPMPPTKTA